ncbi:F-box only protein 10 [Amia ocellicauda]|uniref:F-box only protein 10 n=1 Tax=Amia ocellicauda TaxID=2972642 RepID=UPI003464C6E9
MEVGSLPLELWRLILAYLPLADLGRCSLVCRAWRELILSLDNTRWRQLCLGCAECKHPNWPNQPQLEPRSWREAFKQQSLASRTWSQNGQEMESSNCLYIFRRKKDRKVIHVGLGLEHESLRSALASAGVYDRVVLHPGVYEEQSELVLKVPVEIVGRGKLGEVALLVSFDQQCPTARLCNLVFMPAWFSPILYKTSSGHVQFDNCNLENGQLQVQGPGTCQVRFCTFSQSSVHLHGVALSLLESCEFSGSDNASVTVEGYPTCDRNWACKHLTALARSRSLASVPEWTPETKRQPAGLILDLSKEVYPSSWVAGQGGGDGEGTVVPETSDCSESELSTASDNEEDEPAAYKLSYRPHGLSHLLEQSPEDPSAVVGPRLELRTLQQELQRDKEAQALATSMQGCLVRNCLFRDGKGGVFVCAQGQARLEVSVFRNLTYAVRCIQNAKIIMLKNEVSHCKASGVFLRLSAQGLIADNNIHSNAEAGVDIRKGANPLILCNRIHSGLRSGIVVLGNGKGSVRSNRIYGNKEAGIYILYNGNPVVSGNHIYQGLAAGIAVNENGRGLIVENVIRENQWGGADIRRGGDPVLRNNLICHGYSDGVVVGERGRGLIEGNTIYSNKGCGVWIMSSSLPHISGNRISHNSIYGVAVFCRKDEGGHHLPSQGGNENFNEEGELIAWESDLDSEDERFSSRRPISVALIEANRIGHNGAVGLYIKSSEALNIVGNAVHANRGSGVSVFQSTQLSRLVNNSITSNTAGGVSVEAGCRVELRGNGVYDNSSHGISSKGDGVILENDVIGNHGCALRLLEAADMKVMKNRVQSLHGCGIAVLDQVRGMVQDNLIFQGKAGKALIHKTTAAQECVVQNNELLAFSRKNTDRTEATWVLEDPPPRPHVEGQSSGAPPIQPTPRGVSMTTRITARVESGCHNNGSIFCSIL